MTDTTRTLRIDSGMLEAAKANFTKLVAKATKLGVPPAEMTVGALVEEKHRDEITGRVRIVAYYPVTVTLEPVKLAGWALVAALDHVEGSVITRTVPGMDLPVRYREAKPDCTHCNISRIRNTTFVLVHEDGRYAQVGTSCLADFLGISPAQFVAQGTFLTALGNWESDFEGGYGARSNREHTLGYLGVIARAIQANGWVSRKEAKEFGRKTATADEVNNIINLADYSQDSKVRAEAQAFLASVTDDNRAIAADALAWIRAQHGAEGLSDYLYNLTVLTTGESFDKKYSGLVASLVPVYQRHLGQEVERKAAALAGALSTYQGVIGKRQDVTDLTVTRVHTSEGDYGVRSLVLMVDPAGNRYKWWTGETDLSEGDVFSGKGTVKNHETYKDIKYTVLTRVAVSTPKVGA